MGAHSGLVGRVLVAGTAGWASGVALARAGGRNAPTPVRLAAEVALGVGASTLGCAVAGSVGAQVAGTAAVLGRAWPPGGAGGDGLAVGAGQCMATLPAVASVPIVAAGVVASPEAGEDGRGMAAAGIATAYWSAAAVLWWRRDLRNGWGPAPSAALPAGALATGAVVLHRLYLALRHGGPAPRGRAPMPVLRAVPDPVAAPAPAELDDAAEVADDRAA